MLPKEDVQETDRNNPVLVSPMSVYVCACLSVK